MSCPPTISGCKSTINVPTYGVDLLRKYSAYANLAINPLSSLAFKLSSFPTLSDIIFILHGSAALYPAACDATLIAVPSSRRLSIHNLGSVTLNV